MLHVIPRAVPRRILRTCVCWWYTAVSVVDIACVGFACIAGQNSLCVRLCVCAHSCVFTPQSVLWYMVQDVCSSTKHQCVLLLYSLGAAKRTEKQPFVQCNAGTPLVDAGTVVFLNPNTLLYNVWCRRRTTSSQSSGLKFWVVYGTNH